MSLFKQLWLAVTALLALVLGVSLVVTLLSARAYLEQQLALKNADNAASLALSLTQQGADPVLMELTLAAQFDTGHYELIQLSDPQGKTVLTRRDPRRERGAPAWFVRAFPIRVEPGVASVQTGWQQAGTLTLRSHSRFAYAQLWRSALMLGGLFLLAAIAAGVAGSALLRRILRPLDEVVEQAEALGERRFITTPLPRTSELRRLVTAMNALSMRVKLMLSQEAGRLQKLQRDADTDRVTGLTAREPFMHKLEALLDADSADTTGSLCLLRLAALAQINRSYGRGPADALLRGIGDALQRLAQQRSGWVAARLNGADFILLAPRELNAGALAERARDTVRAVLREHHIADDSPLPGAATVYQHGDRQSELLSRLDGALAGAEWEQSAAIAVANRDDIPVQPLRQQLERWHSLLDEAMRSQQFLLSRFPVVDVDDTLLHYEAPVRLLRAGQQLPAGQFLPWVHRLRMADRLDRVVVDLALTALAEARTPLAVNLSGMALSDPQFGFWLDQELSSRLPQRGALWVEVPEAVVFRQLPDFKLLCGRLKAHGVRVGIEHAGHQLAQLAQLHDVGLDYLKIDAAFVRDLPGSPGHQTLLRTLCTLGHTLGVIVIAEGVHTDAEWAALKELGIDGATGPGITLPGADSRAGDSPDR